MSTQTEYRYSSTTAEAKAFTGANAEATLDLQRDEWRVHDGATTGGFPIPGVKSQLAQTYIHGTVVGTGSPEDPDELTLTLDFPLPALTAGVKVSFLVTQTNTGAVTLNVSGTGTKALKKGGGATALDAEDLVAGGIYEATYDGTQWQLSNGGGGAGGGSFGNALIHVRDEKPSGTASGTFTAGAWRTRTLNTESTNEITGASLSSNQITLPAGDYFAIGRCQGYSVNFHTAKLVDVSNSVDLLIGSTEFANLTGNHQTNSFVYGRFTLGSTVLVELQHRCNNTFATDGFGRALGFSVVEVFAEVMIWKV
jgi:hypothetical protein